MIKTKLQTITETYRWTEKEELWSSDFKAISRATKVMAVVNYIYESEFVYIIEL